MKATIIRGLVGTGKSTLGREIANKSNCLHIEGDMFHIQHGEYKFDRRRTKEVRNLVFKVFKQACHLKCDIVVSNVFGMANQVEKYVKTAKKHKFKVDVIRMTKEYGTTHEIDPNDLEDMQKTFEDYEGETFYHK